MYRGHSCGADQSCPKFQKPAAGGSRQAATSNERIFAGVRHG